MKYQVSQTLDVQVALDLLYPFRSVCQEKQCDVINSESRSTIKAALDILSEAGGNAYSNLIRSKNIPAIHNVVKYEPDCYDITFDIEYVSTLNKVVAGKRVYDNGQECIIPYDKLLNIPELIKKVLENFVCNVDKYGLIPFNRSADSGNIIGARIVMNEGNQLALVVVGLVKDAALWPKKLLDEEAINARITLRDHAYLQDKLESYFKEEGVSVGIKSIYYKHVHLKQGYWLETKSPGKHFCGETKIPLELYSKTLDWYPHIWEYTPNYHMVMKSVLKNSDIGLESKIALVTDNNVVTAVLLSQVSSYVLALMQWPWSRENFFWMRECKMGRAISYINVTEADRKKFIHKGKFVNNKQSNTVAIFWGYINKNAIDDFMKLKKPQVDTIIIVWNHKLTGSEGKVDNFNRLTTIFQRFPPNYAITKVIPVQIEHNAMEYTNIYIIDKIDNQPRGRPMNNMKGAPSKNFQGAPSKNSQGALSKNFQGAPSKNFQGAPSKNAQGALSKNSQGALSKNFQGAPSNNSQSAPSNNSQGAPSNNSQGAPSNNSQGAPSNNSQGAPSNNSQGAPSNNSQGAPSNNSQGAPSKNFQGAPSRSFQRAIVKKMKWRYKKWNRKMKKNRQYPGLVNKLQDFMESQKEMIEEIKQKLLEQKSNQTQPARSSEVQFEHILRTPNPEPMTGQSSIIGCASGSMLDSERKMEYHGSSQGNFRGDAMECKIESRSRSDVGDWVVNDNERFHDDYKRNYGGVPGGDYQMNYREEPERSRDDYQMNYREERERSRDDYQMNYRQTKRFDGDYNMNSKEEPRFERSREYEYERFENEPKPDVTTFSSRSSQQRWEPYDNRKTNTQFGSQCQSERRPYANNSRPYGRDDSWQESGSYPQHEQSGLAPRPGDTQFFNRDQGMNESQGATYPGNSNQLWTEGNYSNFDQRSSVQNRNPEQRQNSWDNFEGGRTQQRQFQDSTRTADDRIGFSQSRQNYGSSTNADMATSSFNRFDYGSSSNQQMQSSTFRPTETNRMYNFDARNSASNRWNENQRNVDRGQQNLPALAQNQKLAKLVEDFNKRNS